jgi:8-oxo-dGTP pyrophosphatase MutT (NUDIX family)
VSERFADDIQRFSAQDVRRRAQERLSLDPAIEAQDHGALPAWGDHVLAPDLLPPNVHIARRPAAVLVPIVAREGGATVLLTQRAAHLRQHSGQIAFPGGKIDETDGSPVHAALREAEEEIGLLPGHVEPVGYLDSYVTGTGFRIFPVVAIVTPPFELTINRTEVDDVFEVPVEFLMEPRNHLLHSREHEGRERKFYAMPYGERYIWGATAGMLRNLYVRLYCE